MTHDGRISLETVNLWIPWAAIKIINFPPPRKVCCLGRHAATVTSTGLKLWWSSLSSLRRRPWRASLKAVPSWRSKWGWSVRKLMKNERDRKESSMSCFVILLLHFLTGLVGNRAGFVTICPPLSSASAAEGRWETRGTGFLQLGSYKKFPLLRIGKF